MILDFHSVSITLTLTRTLSIVFGVNFPGVIRNGFGTNIQGEKGISISPPLFLHMPPLGSTLTLWRLHLHS